ncbi:hypothetical protein J1N35_036869 [Gossypium stocksii]|uniref:Uncharacterized protein n=1 Tax=Gossypium stocksii TaxID=47602 RepID=A0A9D3ZLB6_9ROSI|nr:hypothetical protein J1N35_036869 [Gossypium stocksii]
MDATSTCTSSVSSKRELTINQTAGIIVENVRPLCHNNLQDDDDEEDEDDSSLSPLLKHLPKDFDGDPTNFDNDDDVGDFGTIIMKSDCGRNTRGQSLYSFKLSAVAVASPMKARRNGPNVDDDDNKE